MNILKKINEYKKEKNKEINKILNIKNNYSINFKNDLLKLNDSNNNKILVSEYIFFGIYQSNKKLWIWANSIPGINQTQITEIMNLKVKSYLFENNDNKQALFIYQLLSNDMIEINDPELLKIIGSVLLYLSNSITILKPVNSYGNTQYIGLTKLREKFF